MRYKRSRVESELAAQIKSEMEDATDDERASELAKRIEDHKSKKLMIEQWDLDDIQADIERCGLSGSPTKVYRVQSIVLTKEGYSEIPPTEHGVRQLIHELVVDRTLG
jgi:electron transfer flavoprotein beta subunit